MQGGVEASQMERREVLFEGEEVRCKVRGSLWCVNVVRAWLGRYMINCIREEWGTGHGEG